MPNYRGIRSRFRWGAAHDRELVIGYPLDMVRAYSLPREGSEWSRSPAGVEDAWIVGTDHFLAGDMRHIPRDRETNPPATGWDEADGVEAWLSYMREKNTARFYPDGRNLVDEPKLNTDTNADGIANPLLALSGGQGVIGTRTMDPGEGPAQKVEVTTGPSAVSFFGFQVNIPSMKEGDRVRVSIDSKCAGLAGSTVSRLFAFFRNSIGTNIGGFPGAVHTTSTTWTRLVSGVGTAPPGTVDLAVHFYLSSIDSVDDVGTAWYRNLLVRRGVGDSSELFIDNPGFKTVYLHSPLEEEPGQESINLRRRLPLVLRAADGLPFVGY